MATCAAAKAHTAKNKNRQQEGSTGPPNTAEAEPLTDLLPGRQSCRISGVVAAVIGGPLQKQKGATMKPVIRYRSQLLFRKSYKPNRVIRIRPAQKATLVVRPARAGPQIITYEYETD